MHVAKRIAAAVLLLPAAELVVFLLVAAAIGFALTALMMLATTALGALVLRSAGRGRVRTFRSSVAEGVTVSEAGAGFFTVLGGILLVLPGFITDALGLALLLGPVQRSLGARIVAFFGRSGEPRERVVDLAPDEWRRQPDRALPRRRRQPQRRR